MLITYVYEIKLPGSIYHRFYLAFPDENRVQQYRQLSHIHYHVFHSRNDDTFNQIFTVCIYGSIYKIRFAFLLKIIPNESSGSVH